MAKQKLVVKQKEKSKEKSFEDVCKETANEINGRIKTTQSTMWEIGKIISKRRAEVNPKYGGQFLAGIAERMESEPSLGHLRTCENFHKKFPDLQLRIRKSSLSISHYVVLARYTLEKDEEEKFEEKSKKNKWSVLKLIEEIQKYLHPEMGEGEIERTANNVVDDIFNTFSSFNSYRDELFNEMNFRDITKERANACLTQITYWYVGLPRFINELIRAGATPDKRIVELIKKK